MTKYATRQRIGLVIFAVGAVGTIGWGVGALVTLVDLAIGARADTYVPWLVVGGVPLSVAVAGVLLYGRVPELTPRTGCLGVG